MGVNWEVRKAFYDAQQYRSDRGTPLPGQAGGVPADNGMEVLLQALDKKLQVRTTARAEQDIRTALRLAEEFGYRLVIDEATEAYRVLDLIVAAGVPVVASAPSVLSQRDGAEPRWSTIALLAEKGVPVALQSGEQDALPLVHEAVHAVRAGLPHHLALAAITSVPARILGVEDRVGSLAPGRDGDFVIWSGDPLEVTSRPQAIYIDGIDRTE
jgi:imidazolonepropionase-like amidohydrolase